MKGMKIGIDFGSSSIKIYAENKGIVINEPSIAAIDVDTRKPIAFGKEAAHMGTHVEYREFLYLLILGIRYAFGV